LLPGHPVRRPDHEPLLVPLPHEGPPQRHRAESPPRFSDAALPARSLLPAIPTHRVHAKLSGIGDRIRAPSAALFARRRVDRPRNPSWPHATGFVLRSYLSGPAENMRFHWCPIEVHLWIHRPEFLWLAVPLTSLASSPPACPMLGID